MFWICSQLSIVFVSFSVIDNTYCKIRASNLKLKQKNKKKEFQAPEIYSFGMGNILPLFFASFVFQIQLDIEIVEHIALNPNLCQIEMTKNCT